MAKRLFKHKKASCDRDPSTPSPLLQDASRRRKLKSNSERGSVSRISRRDNENKVNEKLMVPDTTDKSRPRWRSKLVDAGEDAALT